MINLICPSLFRRFLVTTLGFVTSLFLLLLVATWFSPPSDVEVGRDLLLPARAIGLLTLQSNAEQSVLHAQKITQLLEEFSPTPPRKTDVQYAIFRSGDLLLRSNEMPLSFFEFMLTQPSNKVLLRDGWYIVASHFVSAADGAAIGSKDVVVFAMKAAYIKKVQRDAWIDLLPTLLLILLALSAIAWFGSLFALKPIRKLSNSIRSTGVNDSQKQITATGYAELDPVVNAINDRNRVINENLENERLFFATAAHELRTPLAVVSAQAYGVERASNDSQRKMRLVDLQQGVMRAAHAIDRILQLSRLDSSAVSSNVTNFDLAHLTADTVALHAPRAFERLQTISINAPSSLNISAPRSDIESILDNLIENAINYSGSGANIQVELTQTSALAVQILVIDNGPGFSEADFEFATQRFRRGSQSDAHSGSGLGLAIVKAAAHRLGGELGFSLAGVGGLRVQVDLPNSAI